MLGFKLIHRSIGLISTLILARLLLPEHFGIIAMAMSVIAILELATSFGFDIALIRNQKASKEHYNTAWTFNVLFGVSIMLFMVLLAHPAAIFYNKPELTNVILALSLGPLIFGFENIGTVAFRKEMDFRKEFNFQVYKKLLQFFVTVPMALILHNYWALVLGILSGRIAGVILSYKLHPYRPWFSFAAARELYNFSKWLLFTNILAFLRTRSSDFIIGRISGAHALGLFNISYEFSNTPTTELSAPINRAIFPGYAKISEDLSILRKSYLDVLAMLAFVAFPLGVGLAATAEPLVYVALGSKWAEAIPLIQILAFAGVLAATESNSASIYFSIGKPKLLAIVHGVSTVALIPLAIWLTNLHGVVGAAFAFLIVGFFSFPLNFYILSTHLNLKFTNFLLALWRPSVSTAVMFFVVDTYIRYFKKPEELTIYLTIFLSAILLGAIIYVTTTLLLWYVSSKPKGPEQIVIERIVIVMRKYVERGNS